MTGEAETNPDKVCNLGYLAEMMGHKAHLIKGILDTFLTQVPEELRCINEAVEKSEYDVIRRYAHTMKSSVSILGIAALAPILKEMESLSVKEEKMDEIRGLCQKLNVLCEQAIAEIEIEKQNY